MCDAPAAPFSELEPVPAGEPVYFSHDLLIGRHEDCDLLLPHRRVSSQHARLEWRGEGWFLRDLGSTNGTSCNGRTVQGLRALAEGDLIGIAGSFFFRVTRLAVAAAPLGAGWSATEFDGADDAPSLRLILIPCPPEAGRIQIRHGQSLYEQRAQRPYDLLVLLARQPGEWLADDALRSEVYGRNWLNMNRNAYLELLRSLRRILPEGTLQKERGRTRLALSPEAIEIRGTAPSSSAS